MFIYFVISLIKLDADDQNSLSIAYLRCVTFAFSRIAFKQNLRAAFYYLPSNAATLRTHVARSLFYQDCRQFLIRTHGSRKPPHEPNTRDALLISIIAFILFILYSFFSFSLFCSLSHSCAPFFDTAMYYEKKANANYWKMY